jgi:hypothetical protein
MMKRKGRRTDLSSDSDVSVDEASLDAAEPAGPHTPKTKKEEGRRPKKGEGPGISDCDTTVCYPTYASYRSQQ